MKKFKLVPIEFDYCEDYEEYLVERKIEKMIVTIPESKRIKSARNLFN